jgi:hypothetical protein
MSGDKKQLKRLYELDYQPARQINLQAPYQIA